MANDIMAEWQQYPIQVRSDGSYIIHMDGELQCIPQEGITAHFWQEITTWMDENGRMPEPEIKIDLEMGYSSEEIRQMELHARLSQIDLESVRPLRSLADGTGRAEDRAKLIALEAEAKILREELKHLAQLNGKGPNLG